MSSGNFCFLLISRKEEEEEEEEETAGTEVKAPKPIKLITLINQLCQCLVPVYVCNVCKQEEHHHHLGCFFPLLLGTRSLPSSLSFLSLAFNKWSWLISTNTVAGNVISAANDNCNSSNSDSPFLLSHLCAILSLRVATTIQQQQQEQQQEQQ